MSAPDNLEGEPLEADDVLVVRRGPGANCSSIGSALDILFVTATAAGVILVTITAMLDGARKNDPPTPAGDDARAG